MNATTAKGTSGSRLVRTGQHPVKGKEASQHDETSVYGRLGENRGGVERPMDPEAAGHLNAFPVSWGV